MKSFQVGIIGGGVVGSAVAWELSKYKIKTAVFERGVDVASAASKANSGVVHSGINSPSGSLKARFCVDGNKLFQSLADELGFGLKWVGKLVLAKNEYEIKKLERMKKTGLQNSVTDLKILGKTEIKRREPNVTCAAALHVPTAGIVLPYQFTIALAENAALNDVEFFLETKVTDLKKCKDHFLIKTNNGDFQTQIIINAAGVHCREIVSMIEEPDFQVYPCRGEYLVLDKNYSGLVTSMIYPIPVEESGFLGIHITPTIEGNILLGPSSEFIDDLDDRRTTKEMRDTLLKEARKLIPTLPIKSVISAYSGIRCKLVSPHSGRWADYIVEESKNTSGLINLLGIESPGLTAAPAIAKQVKNIISKHVELIAKKEVKVKKQRVKRFSEQSFRDKADLVKKDSSWDRIVCRCENITEAEIVDALSNPLGAIALSSVKYRCRAGMGRCQGGFCTQHIIRIMREKFGIDIKDMKLNSPKSYLFYGRTREVDDDK
jgi:glycerol-3-phosphate dehydrogenase